MARGLRRLIYGTDGAAGRSRRVSTLHDDNFVIESSLDRWTVWEESGLAICGW